MVQRVLVTKAGVGASVIVHGRTYFYGAFLRLSCGYLVPETKVFTP